MDDQEPDSTKKLPEGRDCGLIVNPGNDHLKFDTDKLSTNDIDVIILGNSCKEDIEENSMVNKDIEYRLGCQGSPAPTSTYQTFQHNFEYEIPHSIGGASTTVKSLGEVDGKPPALPKLTIKRTAPLVESQLTSFFSSSPASNSGTHDVSESVPKEQEDGASDPLAVPKLKLKITKDTQVATEYQPIPKLTIKTNYLEQGSSTTVIREDIPESLPKLKLKTTYKAEEMTPLEIVTPAQKIVVDSTEENCQKSPRIILKINKNQSYCVSSTNCTDTAMPKVQEASTTTFSTASSAVASPNPSSSPKASPDPPSSPNDTDVQIICVEEDHANGDANAKNAEDFSSADNQVNSTEIDMDCVMVDEPQETNGNGRIIKADLPLSSTNEMSDDVSFSNSINDNCIIIPDESNSDCMLVSKTSNSMEEDDPLQLQNFKECFPTFDSSLPETSTENSVAEVLAVPEVPVKRRRGRPRKHPIPDTEVVADSTVSTTNHQRSPSPTRKVRKKRMKRTPVAPAKVQTSKATPPARQKFNKVG